MSSSPWAILVAIVTATFVLSPAVTPPFMGYTSEQLPFVVDNPPIQPAGYAFSIWGVIYTWLVVSAVFGLVKRRADLAWDRARQPLAVSLLIGTFWLWIAGQSAIWGSVTIVLMLITAAWAMIRAPRTDRWWLATPLALYAGWLSAASIVSVSVTVEGYGLGVGWTSSALVGIVFAVILAALVQARRKWLPAYSIPVIWALIAIVVANAGSAMQVQIVAAFAAVLVTLAAVLMYRRS